MAATPRTNAIPFRKIDVSTEEQAKNFAPWPLTLGTCQAKTISLNLVYKKLPLVLNSSDISMKADGTHELYQVYLDENNTMMLSLSFKLSATAATCISWQHEVVKGSDDEDSSSTSDSDPETSLEEVNDGLSDVEADPVEAVKPAPSVRPAVAITPTKPVVGVKPAPLARSAVTSSPATTPAKPGVVAATPTKPVVVATTPAKPAVVAATPAKPAVVAATPAKPAVVAATPTKPAVPTKPVVVTTTLAKPVVATTPAKPAVPTKPVVATTPTKPVVATTPAKPAVVANTTVKPAVAPTKPAVAPTKPAVAPTKPAVAPTKPAVAPTKPAVAPAVAPSKPAVAPSKPAVAPSKPAVAPAKAAVTPTSVAKTTVVPIKPPAKSAPVMNIPIKSIGKPASGSGSGSGCGFSKPLPTETKTEVVKPVRSDARLTAKQIPISIKSPQKSPVEGAVSSPGRTRIPTKVSAVHTKVSAVPTKLSAVPTKVSAVPTNIMKFHSKVADDRVTSKKRHAEPEDEPEDAADEEESQRKAKKRAKKEAKKEAKKAKKAEKKQRRHEKKAKKESEDSDEDVNVVDMDDAELVAPKKKQKRSDKNKKATEKEEQKEEESEKTDSDANTADGEGADEDSRLEHTIYDENLACDRIPEPLLHLAYGITLNENLITPEVWANVIKNTKASHNLTFLHAIDEHVVPEFDDGFVLDENHLLTHALLFGGTTPFDIHQRSLGTQRRGFNVAQSKKFYDICNLVASMISYQPTVIIYHPFQKLDQGMYKKDGLNFSTEEKRSLMLNMSEISFTLKVTKLSTNSTKEIILGYGCYLEFSSDYNIRVQETKEQCSTSDRDYFLFFTLHKEAKGRGGRKPSTSAQTAATTTSDALAILQKQSITETIGEFSKLIQPIHDKLKESNEQMESMGDVLRALSESNRNAIESAVELQTATLELTDARDKHFNLECELSELKQKLAKNQEEHDKKMRDGLAENNRLLSQFLFKEKVKDMASLTTSNPHLNQTFHDVRNSVMERNESFKRLRDQSKSRTPEKRRVIDDDQQTNIPTTGKF
jgi:hypothetical protein